MGEFDVDKSEYWRGWLDGKNENPYKTPRHNKQNYSKSKGSKKKKISFVCLIVCFCVISISGIILLGSNDYTNVELSN